MSTPSCLGQRLGHNFPVAGGDCINCGINQKVLSGTARKPKDLAPVIEGMDAAAFLAALASRRKERRASTYLNEVIDQIWTDFERRLAFFAIHEEPFSLAKYQRMRAAFFSLGNKLHDAGKLKTLWEWAQNKGVMGEQFLKVLAKTVITRKAS